MKHTNIEIKARCADTERIRKILKSLNARFIGEDHQIDTYFNVPKGRLKLRQGNIENSLIFYRRADSAAPKQSDIVLLKTEPDSGLKDMLTKALGAKVIVDKKREIYFIDNVKFHIDAVKGLGKFVEIEAIDENGDVGREKLLKQCLHYLNTFGIKEVDLIPNSYSDLLSSAI